MQSKEHNFPFKNLFVPLTTLKAILWITIIGLISYFNSLFGGFIGDDSAQIAGNIAVHSLKNIGEFFLSSTFNNGGVGLTGMYYKPLLTTSYSVIYSIFQTWTFPYHVLQLTLHITNAILLFLIFRRFFKKELSFFLSLIFLLHPINNEAVVSIAALQEPLFLFFGLLALQITQKIKEGRVKKIEVTILLLFSLLSKETGIAFIMIIPFFSKVIKNKWLPTLYESVIALGIYLLLRIGVAHIYFNQPHIFSYSFTKLNLLQRLLNIPAIVWFYVQTFLYPMQLLVYQRWIVTSINFWNFYLPLLIDTLFFGSLIVCGYWIYKKRREQFKIYIFSLLWFVIGILLHLQLIPLDYTVADRWFYFPIVGLLGMIGVIISLVKFTNKIYSWVFITVISLVLILFLIRDIARNSDWVNAATLYTHDIVYEPDNYEAQSGLGIELYNQGKYTEAKKHLLYSIKLYPTTQNWAALGFVYEKQHEIPKAKSALLSALFYKNDPFSYQSLIKIMLVYDTPETTILFIQKELTNNPNDPSLWLYLAVEEYKLGKKNDALVDVKKSYNIYPSEESRYVYEKITNNEPIRLIYK